LVVAKITERDAVDKPDSKMEMVKSSLKNLNGGKLKEYIRLQ
jgi:hypothetical protein